jgi:hypothetical protein
MTPEEKAETRQRFDKHVAACRTGLDAIDRIRNAWPLIVQTHPWTAPFIFVQWLLLVPYAKGLRALMNFLERTMPK